MIGATDTTIFKALADPTRLRLVILLLERECCVCDLTAALGLPQSTVSRHMAKLRASGLVQDRRAGKWVYYSLVEGSPVSELRAYLSQLGRSDTYEPDRRRLRDFLQTKTC